MRGVVVRRGRERPEIEAGRVIVCAGAYDSPALLLRSGIGPAGDLRALGIPVVADLPGVGANLHDHPAFELPFGGTPELHEACRAHAASGAFAPIEGVIAKLRSDRVRAGGLRPPRLSGRRRRARRRRVLDPGRLHDAALARQRAA